MSNCTGADWMQAQLNYEKAPIQMSDFGREVADIEGFVARGLHHIPLKSLLKAEWADPACISLTWYHELAAYDGSALTELVVLCHDRVIRLAVKPLAPAYLRLHFLRRERDGGTTARCPTLEEQVARIRKQAGLGIVPDPSARPATNHIQSVRPERGELCEGRR